MENDNLAPGHQFKLSQVKVVNEVKVTQRSRSFQGQIVSVVSDFLLASGRWAFD